MVDDLEESADIKANIGEDTSIVQDHKPFQEKEKVNYNVDLVFELVE